METEYRCCYLCKLNKALSIISPNSNKAYDLNASTVWRLAEKWNFPLLEPSSNVALLSEGFKQSEFIEEMR